MGKPVDLAGLLHTGYDVSCSPVSAASGDTRVLFEREVRRGQVGGGDLLRGEQRRPAHVGRVARVLHATHPRDGVRANGCHRNKPASPSSCSRVRL